MCSFSASRERVKHLTLVTRNALLLSANMRRVSSAMFNKRSHLCAATLESVTLLPISCLCVNYNLSGLTSVVLKYICCDLSASIFYVCSMADVAFFLSPVVRYLFSCPFDWPSVASHYRCSNSLRSSVSFDTAFNAIEPRPFQLLDCKACACMRLHSTRECT